jgi:hypothetical protein
MKKSTLKTALESIAWILMDPEHNGPGFLNISDD